MPINDSSLNTIIEPERIHFTFDAIGWTILAYSLVLIFAIVLICVIIKYRHNKYRRLAIKQLSFIHTNASSLQIKVSEANKLIKRISILKYGRQQVAMLTDEEWLAFLNTKTPVFQKETFLQTQVGLFDESILDKKLVNTFISQTKNWINKHVV